MEIKSINTRYKGYYFRSRLEARWAVYFDSLGIKWEYEKEGFHLEHEFKDGTEWFDYLPDFWFPDLEVWGEVKSEKDAPLGIFTNDSLKKACLLVKNTHHQLLMLVGIPEKKRVYSIEEDECFNDVEGITNGLMIGYAYVLSNYHNYPKDEHRFYAEPSDEEIDSNMFQDSEEASDKAKSARFEFKEERNGNGI
jgi:hypothetical protein